MFLTLEEFILTTQQICHQYNYYPIVEYSYKLANQTENNNRCVIVIDKIDYIFTSCEIIKLLQLLHFSEYFNDFIINISHSSRISQLIVGIDIAKQIEKCYLVLDNMTLDIHNMIAMEIHNNQTIIYKKYVPIKGPSSFMTIFNRIFPVHQARQMYHLCKLYCSWGYVRINLSKQHLLYGIDLFIEKPIYQMIPFISKLNNICQLIQPKQLHKWLQENKNNKLYWIGINYRNQKLDICLYYRKNKTKCVNTVYNHIQDVVNYYNQEKTIQKIQDTDYYGTRLWHTPLQFIYKEKTFSEMGLIQYLAKIKKDSVVMDWGCGLGTLLQMIYKRIPCQLYGVNLSIKQIQLAKKYIHPSIQLLLTKGTYIPLQSQTINSIVSQEAIVHHPDKQELFNEFNAHSDKIKFSLSFVKFRSWKALVKHLRLADPNQPNLTSSHIPKLAWMTIPKKPKHLNSKELVETTIASTTKVWSWKNAKQAFRNIKDLSSITLPNTPIKSFKTGQHIPTTPHIVFSNQNDPNTKRFLLPIASFQ